LKVENVTSQSIASRAKLEEGDVIVSVNNHTVTTEQDFVRFLYADTSDRVAIVVLRDDEEVTLYIEPAWLVEETVTTNVGGWLGVDLDDRYRRDVVVRMVHRNSPAERAGLRAGDAILSVDDREIDSPTHLGQVIGGMRPGSTVELEVERNGRVRFVEATLGERAEVSRRTEVRPQRR
jgi:serine protease Do